VVVAAGIGEPHLTGLALGHLEDGAHALASFVDVEEVNGIVLEYLLLLKLPQVGRQDLKCVFTAQREFLEGQARHLRFRALRSCSHRPSLMRTSTLASECLAKVSMTDCHPQ
jgi:hypothetical protein